MSLINQALKKAQRDHGTARGATSPSTGDAAHQPGGSSGAPRRNPLLVSGVVAAFALLVGLVAGLSFVLLQQPPPHSTSTQPREEQASSPAPDAPPDTMEAEESPPKRNASDEPADSSTEEAAAQPAPLSFDAQRGEEFAETLFQARQASVEKLKEEKATGKNTSTEAAESEDTTTPSNDEKESTVSPDETPAELKENIMDWLARAKINGVRLSDKGNKVLLNNRAYKTDDTVRYKYDLKVLIIQEHRILFVDGYGTKYLKRL
ncbi:MAG: hypothetical protein ACLFO5_06915 [Opitutales bacterium]